MHQIDMEKIVSNKFSILLVTLIFFIVLSPLNLGNENLAFLIQGLLFFITILVILKILEIKKSFFLVFLSLAISALLLQYLADFNIIPEFKKWILMAGLILYMFCISFAILFMVRKIFAEKLVTGDTVQGGISIFLLFGIWWGILYYLIWLVTPTAFVFGIHQATLSEFFYFSLTTITTLGYGDILPKSPIGKIFSTLEALTGQIYLAVFIARLVSLQMTGPKSEN